MPNHVINIVRLGGEEDKIRELVEFVKSGDMPFDFNQIISMPPHIKREGLTSEEKQRTKGRNWYDWSIAHWGTKWNCYEIDFIEEEFTYAFSTAWSAPEPVIRELSRLFPEITITHMWCDEDWLSGNCGEIEIENGEIQFNRDFETEVEIREFAAEILGFDPETEF